MNVEVGNFKGAVALLRPVNASEIALSQPHEV